MMNHWKNLSLSDIVENIDGTFVIEQWMSIVGYESCYKISSFGRIKSLFRIVPTTHNVRKVKESIIKQHLGHGGYLYATLCCCNKKMSSTVHSLTAKHWVSNPSNKPTVNHKKGIKTDNRCWELEWATEKEQDTHARATGLKIPIYGEQCSYTKLKNYQVLEIFNSESKNNYLANKYGVTEPVICAIKKGRARANITGAKFENSRLKPQIIKNIFECTLSLRKTAKKFGISSGSVYMIKSGKRYSEITSSLH